MHCLRSLVLLHCVKAGARGQAHANMDTAYGGQLRFESQRFTRVSPGR